MKIKKALITCAGFGTRFLPITKTIQKEMLPILNRPLIDYVVEDCIKAGIEDIIFVVGEHNYQVMHYYRENQRLYEYLKKFNKIQLYEQIAHLHTQANFHFVKQKDSDPYGTATPVILAKDYLVNEEAFLVLMGDDFVYQGKAEQQAGVKQASEQSMVAKMIQDYVQSGAKALLTCVEKPQEILHKYGVIKGYRDGNFNFLAEIVEKPAPGQAPSNLVNISKYILSQEIWPILAQQKINPQFGELFITDSLQILSQKHKVVVHQPQGTYLDGGYVLGWLLANLTLAKDDPEIYPVIKDFVKRNY